MAVLRRNYIASLGIMLMAAGLAALGTFHASLDVAAHLAWAVGLFSLGAGIFIGVLIDRSIRPSRLVIARRRFSTTTQPDEKRPGWRLDGSFLLSNESAHNPATPNEIWLRNLRRGRRLPVRRRFENRQGEIWVQGDGGNRPAVTSDASPVTFNAHFYVTRKETKGAGTIRARVTIVDSVGRRHRGTIVFPAPPIGQATPS
jgi:hypothetical protein